MNLPVIQKQRFINKQSRKLAILVGTVLYAGDPDSGRGDWDLCAVYVYDDGLDLHLSTPLDAFHEKFEAQDEGARARLTEYFDS